MMFGMNGYFTTAAAASSGVGPAAQLGFFSTFTDGFSPIEFQLGVSVKAASGIDATGIHSLQAPYLVARIQITRLYLGFGATPWAWGRNGPTVGFDNLQLGPLNYAMLAELGLLFAGTPRFSAALQLSAQTLVGTYGLSPMPAADASLMFRFYFDILSGGSGPDPDSAPGHSGTSGTRRLPNEYRGWRYPFGMERK